MLKISTLFGFFVILFCHNCVASANDAWTWLYRKSFSAHEMRANKEKKHVLFEKKHVPSFSQLIFSWNAFRPKTGSFSFFVKVRNARTKKWTSWYKMMEWGANVQRSFFSSAGGTLTKNVYVRLEAGKHDADAFVVKAVAYSGASFKGLKGFSVCTTNFKKFKTEKINDAFCNLPSVYIKSVPKKSQMILNHPRAAHMCSPTSCAMIAGFLLQENIDPLNFANNVFDDGLDTYGSWPFNSAYAFECCRGKAFFSVARLPSFTALHKLLKRRIPVAVSVRGMLNGAPKSYENGHLIVVVGWDKKRKQVLCHDPAMGTDRRTLKRYDLNCFLRAWERSRRLSYIAERIW